MCLAVPDAVSGVIANLMLCGKAETPEDVCNLLRDHFAAAYRDAGLVFEAFYVRCTADDVTQEACPAAVLFCSMAEYM